MGVTVHYPDDFKAIVFSGKLGPKVSFGRDRVHLGGIRVVPGGHESGAFCRGVRTASWSANDQPARFHGQAVIGVGDYFGIGAASELQHELYGSGIVVR